MAKEKEEQEILKSVRDQVISELSCWLDERIVLCHLKNDGSMAPILLDESFTPEILRSMRDQGNLPGGEKYNELVKSGGVDPAIREPAYFQIKIMEIGGGEDTSKLLPPEYTILGVVLGASSTYNVYLRRIDLSAVEPGPSYVLTERGRIEPNPI